jgi:hypothetical protein
MDKITIKPANDIERFGSEKWVIEVESLKDVSDGYHTIDELYEHRCSLFILLCQQHKELVFWKMDMSSPGWFILYIETKYGQISYHIKDSFLPMVKNFAVEDPEHVWDGHTSKDVLERMEKLMGDEYW